MDYINVVEPHDGFARIDFDIYQYHPPKEEIVRQVNVSYLNGDVSYVDFDNLNNGIIVLIKNTSGQLHGDLRRAVERLMECIKAYPKPA